MAIKKTQNLLQITVIFSFYSACVIGADKFDGTHFLYCNEITDPEYLSVVFTIDEKGWLYDVINSKEFRLKHYGSVSYAFQTLASNAKSNPYYVQSWVHRNGQDYTLLTASSFSREFRLDMSELIFHEVESGVESRNLSGNCVELNVSELVSITQQIEREFQEWAAMQ